MLRRFSTFTGLTMNFTALCLVVLLHLVTLSSSSRFDLDSCGSHCEKSYRQTFELSACLRGCRLCSINQLSPARLTKDEAVQQCSQDCKMCYGSLVSSSAACNDGCQRQETLPTPAAMQRIEEENFAFAFRISPFVPHTGILIHQYCYRMLSSAVTFIGISSYLSRDHGQAVLVKIEVTEQQPFNLQGSASEETMIVASFNGDSPNTWSLHPVTIYRVSNTWIGCVAMKVGLPKWLIASVLILSIVTVFYLCCYPLFEDDDDKKLVTFAKELSISANDIERVPLFTVKSHEADAIPDKLLLA